MIKQIYSNVNITIMKLDDDKFYLYQVVYYKKFFGNLIVDINHSNFCFRFVNDRQEYKCIICKTDNSDKTYHFSDICLLLNINSEFPINDFYSFIYEILLCFQKNIDLFISIFDNERDLIKKLAPLEELKDPRYLFYNKFQAFFFCEYWKNTNGII